MNKKLFEYFSESNVPYTLLPHQISTIDYMLRHCYKDKKNLLIYHRMGSGKTILNLVFALLICKYYKVVIVVPNINLKKIWKENMNKALNIIGNININIENIKIITRIKFIEVIENFDFDMANKIKLYEDHFIIIDEVHNYFGNTSGINLLKLKKHFNSVFILLTGSPILNTIDPIKDLIYLLTGSDDFKSNYIIYGNRVYDKYITKEGKEYIKHKLKGYISSYNKIIDGIPKHLYFGRILISYPFIICPMSELQRTWYTKIKAEMNESNEMFSTILNNLSFCVLGDVKNYTELLNINERKQLLPDLIFNGTKLQGEELIKLDISSKFKYFITNYVINLKPTKKFIYFNNSGIGTLIIKSIMEANGVSEYEKTIVKNFRCVICNMKRTCETCYPAKYLIITSLSEIDNIGELLDEFNKDENDDGKYILYLFGSKIISEAYTLKEIRDIIFLTIPNSKGELEQIVARALRKFSYKNIEINVNIWILMALDPVDERNKKLLNLNTQIFDKIKATAETEIVDYYTNMLNQEVLNYDLKKLLYLELKSKHSESILKILKNIQTEYYDNPVPFLYPLVYIERLKRYFYSNESCKNMVDIFKINNLTILPVEFIEQNDFSEYILYNKTLKNCFIYDISSKDLFTKSIIKSNSSTQFILLPHKITQVEHLMMLPLNIFLSK